MLFYQKYSNAENVKFYSKCTINGWQILCLFVSVVQWFLLQILIHSFENAVLFEILNAENMKFYSKCTTNDWQRLSLFLYVVQWFLLQILIHSFENALKTDLDIFD